MSRYPFGVSNSNLGGFGGIGKQSSITGAAVWYAGGGAGGLNYNDPCNVLADTTKFVNDCCAMGGQGGGGNGNSLSYDSSCSTTIRSSFDGTDGAPGTGGGGGGTDCESLVAGAGGSGIVIMRYL